MSTAAESFWLEDTPTPGPVYAAVLSGSYGEPYHFETSEVPRAGAEEAVIRVEYSGVCHGDVYSRNGGGPAPLTPRRPLTGGHEGVGYIAALGSQTNSRFSIGDRVGIAWRGRICGTCDACRAGAENHCPSKQIVGMHHNGTFQTHMSFPVRELVRLPTDIDGPSACPILCAGVTSYVALKKLQPQPGKWCVVSGGAGGVGHLAIQYAKQVFGLRVLAIDGGSVEKEQFCKDMGCDEYVDFMEEGANLAQTVMARTGGGADYVVILSPNQAAYSAAGEYARFRAQIMAVGIGNCNFSLRPILMKDLTVRSTETGTKEDIEEALELTANGTIKGRIEVMGVSDLNHALDRLREGDVMGKLVVDLRPIEMSSSAVSKRPSALL